MFILLRIVFRRAQTAALRKTAILVVSSIARQIFNFQRSDFFEILHFTANLEDAENQSPVSGYSPSVSSVMMVGLDRLELSTSPLSGVRSSHLSYRPGPEAFFRPFPSVGISSPPLFKRPATGGAGRDRTGDLLNANQALSQLSYSPLTIDFDPPNHIWE